MDVARSRTRAAVRRRRPSQVAGRSLSSGNKKWQKDLTRIAERTTSVAKSTHLPTHETELKFVLDDITPRELWARVKALKLQSTGPRAKTLRTTYFDTPDHALKKAGIALRLRRDGRRWVQTVKTNAKLHGGLSRVGEVENHAPGGRLDIQAIPDVSTREEVLRRTKGAALLPVCETVIKRSAAELSLEDGTRAELAIDVGEIRASGHSADLRELEIELIEGKPGRLFDIAQALLPAGGLRFSRLSKGARGYLLAKEGRIEPPLEPRNAEPIAVEPTEIAEHAALATLRECLDQIATNVVVVRKLDEIEGPHQLRIGLRRLRSAFSVYSPVLSCPEMDRLSREAKWLGQEVGRLRDLDVVAKDIVGREARLNPDEPGLSALAEALAQQAAQQREHVRTLLVSPRAQSFLIALARFEETRGWLVAEDFEQTERLAMPALRLSRRSLTKCWKKVDRLAQHLEQLNAEQRHELRKELKKLRYATEFFSPIYSAKQVRKFLKSLKMLQAVFGDLNDAVTVKAIMAEETNRLDGRDAGVQRAIGWVIGASQTRAEFGWNMAKDLWRDLDQARPFWK